mmetsp:Transcript_22571/g.49929  ORF Transcript_22571/g.49929 Transcript_22571/m.49929 type:complete len:401 (+) Transcript_22571:55-1257(+)
MGARCSHASSTAGDVLTQAEEPTLQVEDEDIGEACPCPQIVASAKLAEPGVDDLTEGQDDGPPLSEQRLQGCAGTSIATERASLDISIPRSEAGKTSTSLQPEGADGPKRSKQKSSSFEKRPPKQQQQPQQPPQPRKEDPEVEKRRRRLQKRLEADRRKKKEVEVRMVENRQLVEDILAGKYKDTSKPSKLGGGGSLLIRMPAPAERENTRLFVLGQFRAQYAKLGKHDSCPSAPTTSQYTAQENQGLQIKEGHRSLPRPNGVALPRSFRKAVGECTAQQLAQFGCDSDRKLLSVYGDIFDVSDRPDKYGIDGPYSWMTGNDITWGFVSGRDVPEMVNQYYDLWKVAPESLRESKLRLIYGWVAWYEFEYGDPVGKLLTYKNEAALKGPPIEEAEDCCVM